MQCWIASLHQHEWHDLCVSVCAMLLKFLFHCCYWPFLWWHSSSSSSNSSNSCASEYSIYTDRHKYALWLHTVSCGGRNALAGFLKEKVDTALWPERETPEREHTGTMIGPHKTRHLFTIATRRCKAREKEKREKSGKAVCNNNNNNNNLFYTILIFRPFFIFPNARDKYTHSTQPARREQRERDSNARAADIGHAHTHATAVASA